MYFGDFSSSAFYFSILGAYSVWTLSLLLWMWLWEILSNKTSFWTIINLYLTKKMLRILSQCIFSAFDVDLPSEIPDISLNLLELFDKFFTLFQFYKYLRSPYLILIIMSRALLYVFVCIYIYIYIYIYYIHIYIYLYTYIYIL